MGASLGTMLFSAYSDQSLVFVPCRALSSLPVQLRHWPFQAIDILLYVKIPAWTFRQLVVFQILALVVLA